MRLLFNFLLFVVLSVILGIGSAWQMVENGNALATKRLGPWVTWIQAGNPEADPYTKAHFTRSGQLPITSTAARYFYAATDDDKSPLTTSCEYTVEGRPLDALWWSIAIYSQDGQFFANKADRHAFNSTNIFLHEDGSFQIRIAKNARSGNWLPVSGDKNFKLLMRVYRPERPDDVGRGKDKKSKLPRIKREICE